MSEETDKITEITVSCPGEDGDEEFTMSRFAAMRCDVIQAHIEMIEEEQMQAGVLPLSNISADLMPIIIEYLEEPYGEHQGGELTDFELGWVPEDPKELAPLIMAANFIDCQDMMETLTWHTANLMKGMTPEGLREMFGTPDDIPEDKKKIIHEQNKFLLEK